MPNGATSTGGRAAAAIEMRLESVAGRGRADDYRVRQGRGGLDPPAMPQVLARAGVFGKLHRNQIVDQADKARPAAPLEPRDQPAALEMMVRHQQIDRPVGGWLRRTERRQARPQRLERQLPRQPAAPAADPRRFAQHRATSRRVRRRRPRPPAAAISPARPTASSRRSAAADPTRSDARHRRARPGRCRSACRAWRATAGAKRQRRSPAPACQNPREADQAPSSR